MRPYLILTPPGGPAPDHRSTLVIKDGFSWAGFFLSWIWLFWQKLWLAGVIVLALQIVSGVLMQMPALMPVGVALGLALSLLVGLESRNYLSDALVRRGWTLEAVIFAQDRETAEEIYFSGLPTAPSSPLPDSSNWAGRAVDSRGGSPGLNLGLFDYGGR
ncbi:DUF2628 domain-containing protein [Neorhizobium lilium]|uniref:DUF2628 domain-containing protein n=1 Tax=Neorhizobium lilium TaxID=2503024 RepID=UPI0013E2C334|nr:DUF2628 domain-containing protein [Neorhizobium lilium]